VVRRHFSKGFFFYRIASHERCGCAFGEPGEYSDPNNPAQAGSARRFAAFLTDCLGRVEALEAYAVWTGDEELAPVARVAMSLHDIGDEVRIFSERTLVHLVVEAGPRRG
jgi:hypothetical protein